MAISTRSQGEVFTIASWEDIDKLFAREGGLAANVYIFASLFNHRQFPALLTSLLATKTEEDQLTLDALQILFAKVYRHAALGQGKAFILASLQYDLIFNEFITDDFFNFLYFSPNDYTEQEIDLITHKAFATKYFFDLENPYSLTLNLQLTWLPEKYATQLLDQVFTTEGCWLKMMTANHGYLYSATLLLNKIPSAHAKRLCAKIFDENDGLQYFLKNSGTLIRILTYVDPSCYELIISRITQNSETWSQFLSHYAFDKQQFFYLNPAMPFSKYHAILMSLNDILPVKRMLIAALKRLDISLLHMVCEQPYSQITINDHLQHLIYYLLNGADPTWIPSGYQANALVQLINYFIKQDVVLPLSIAVKDAMIEMLRLGVEPLEANVVFDRMLNEVIDNFPKRFTVALDLGVLPSNQSLFLESKRTTVVRLNDQNPQQVDSDLLITILTYFDLKQMTADMRALLSQKLVALFPKLPPTISSMPIPAQKSIFTKLRSDYRPNRDNMLIACLLYMLDYQQRQPRYYLASLPKDVLLMIFDYIDPKSDSAALLAFCLANRDRYDELAQLPGTVCLFETKAFYISALSLATQYEKLAPDSKPGFRNNAKPHLATHLSLFKLPAHAAALKNTLQDSELFRDTYHV